MLACRVFVPLVALAAFLPAGCGGGGTTPIVDETPALRVSRALPNGLTATLSQDRAVVPVLSAVTYTLILVNTTNAPVTIAAARNLATGAIVPQTTLRVTDTAGVLLLQVSRAQPRLTPVYDRTVITLAPGESIAEAHTFSALFLEPGRYEASATFVTGENAEVAPVGPLAIVAERP